MPCIYIFSLSQKVGQNQKGRLWVHETSLKYFCDPHRELIWHDKWHPGILEIPAPTEIAVETHFYMGHGNETISVFLPAYGKASYLVLSTLVSLISDGTVQSENAYFFHSLQRGKCHFH